MVEGAILILLVLIVFLRRFWASVVVIVVVPLSLLFAFILIDMKHVSANLISLGAIDFGLIVDSAVVLVEAIMVKVTLDMHQKASIAHMRQSMLTTTVEMARPILFSKAILIIAFIPIFTFQRVEEKIFSPMAFTLTFALLGSLIVSLTLIPVLLSYLLGPRLTESHNPLIHGMERRYLSILEAVLRHPRRLFVGAGITLALSLASWPLIGTEFMPKLDEGKYGRRSLCRRLYRSIKPKTWRKIYAPAYRSFAKRSQFSRNWDVLKTVPIPKASITSKFSLISSQKKPGDMAIRRSWSRQWNNGWQYFRDCSSIFPK